MRKATDITVKRNKLGFSEVDLPEEGEIMDLGEAVFQVYDLKVINNGCSNVAEFMLGTMDGELAITVKIASTKPFRTK